MSKIEWTDVTWNPVTGCWGPGGTAEDPQWCSYCYARTMARRLKGMGQEKYAAEFVPRFHRAELERPKRWRKPRRIFVCSMADLFGSWIDADTIESVLEVARQCPQHTFQFLTKNPARVAGIDWPSNAWVGATVTNQETANEALRWLRYVTAPVRFLSVEPIRGPVELHSMFALEWVIIGRMTGPGGINAEFDPQWVEWLTAQAKANRLAVFHKANLGGYGHLQEFPG